MFATRKSDFDAICVSIIMTRAKRGRREIIEFKTYPILIVTINYSCHMWVCVSMVSSSVLRDYRIMSKHRRNFGVLMEPPYETICCPRKGLKRKWEKGWSQLKSQFCQNRIFVRPKSDSLPSYNSFFRPSWIKVVVKKLFNE